MKLGKRITALLLVAAVGLGAVGCSKVNGQETKVKVVRVAHGQNEDHPQHKAMLEFEKYVEEKTNGAVKARALLDLYNQKTRSLEIKNALGDIRVRGGSLIIVNLNLGDVKLQNFMLVEKAKHTFKNGEHFMDLTLRGQNFISQ